MAETSQIQRERGQFKQMAAQLRKAATPAEQRAWSLLRGRRFQGLKFRRQHILEGKIVDFYCHELRLKGYKVIRFMNEELLGDPGYFTERLSKHCQAPHL